MKPRYQQPIPERSLYERVTLTLRTMAQSMLIDDSTLRLANVETSVVRDFIGAFRCSVHALMAGQVVEKHLYPRDWWQAFKARWFPKWLLRRYPVEFQKIETWHCYPEYPLEDKCGNSIQFMVFDPPKNWLSVSSED